MPFRESTRRLRDSAMTTADYELWWFRDIATAECSEELKVRADSFLLL